MARNHWITLESGHALRDAEIRELIRGSYELVLAKLPKRTQAALGPGESNAGKKKKQAKRRRSPVR
jgi:predicted DNA-binding protein (MmcQ/YjbR family)